MKKLTAGIFTVLMGLVSINAADAAVASKGYVDQQVKVNADAISAMDTAYKAADTGLDTRLQAVEALNGTGAGSVSAQISALETSLKGYADTAESDAVAAAKSYADTELAKKVNKADAVLTQVGANGSYIKYVSQADGKVSATEEAFVTEITDATKASTVAPQTAAVVSYVEGELTAVTGQEGIAGLKTAVTNLNNNKADKSDTYTKAQVDAAVKVNTDAIAAINNEDTGILALAKADATSKANAAQSAAEDKVTELANGAVKTNTEAIAAINNAETGILKQAQNYADTAEADAIAAAGTAADTKINTALEAYSTTAEMNSAIATATTDMATQTYVVSKANAALDASVGYTDSVVASLKLADIARVPAACGETGKYCVLTTDNTKFVWEVIERSESEAASYNPTGVTVPDVATVSKPAAIVK